MATYRTLIPPRSNDGSSFLGTYRWQYQVAPTNPKTGQPEPISPPVEGAPQPYRG